MSANETTQPANRIRLSDPKTDPNPPWTGLKFTCERCGALHQLGCADECSPIEGTANGFLAPPCWTCEYRNVITIPAEPEGNPS